jgi:hypothetical protein
MCFHDATHVTEILLCEELAEDVDVSRSDNEQPYIQRVTISGSGHDIGGCQHVSDCSVV